MLKKTFFLFLTLSFFLFNQSVSYADEREDLEKQITEYTQKLSELGTAKNTLANQIKILNSQYELTLLRITQTESSIKVLEKEIAGLTVEIDSLNTKLNQLSSLYVLQIIENYKLQKKVPTFAFLFSSKLNTYLEQYKYVANVQNASQNSLINMETVRSNYDAQKTAKTQKQQEMETLQKTLATQKDNVISQKAAKNNLLETTKNDEKKYQQLLDNARSELAAISSILAGKGVETEVKTVFEGERIASVIYGPSCSSSGTHLHFMITKNNVVQNPFNYLKSIDFSNCSGSTCGSGGDPFNPSGNWNWPLSPIIKLNQGYGSTWAISHTWVKQIYSFHNGIDIAGSSDQVTTPIPGTLYRGSYYIKSSGCYLRYVKVIGKDGMGTLNLHVNY